MGIAKVIEITSESPKSFEDAIRQGIENASKTVRHINGAWVKEQRSSTTAKSRATGPTSR